MGTMHRFANPGSDLSSIVKMFSFLHENIEVEEYFDIPAMQHILVNAGYITSSGTVGLAALEKGANTDTSRDKTYNQCKMYAEIYRTLGWIQSHENRSLDYTFTLLGHYVVANINNSFLLEECFIGIELPNKVISTGNLQKQRIVKLVLNSMQELGGVLSKEENIYLGFIEDDTNERLVTAALDEILHYRNTSGKGLRDRLDKLLEKRGISYQTAGNYWRLLRGAMIYLNWCEKYRDKTSYKRPTSVYKITQKGEDVLNVIRTKKDLRLDEVQSKQIEEIASISGFYSMLERAGIDISEKALLKTEYDKMLEQKLGTSDVIFSPFQALDPVTLSKIFGVHFPKLKTQFSSPIVPIVSTREYSNFGIPLYPKQKEKSITDLAIKIEGLLSSGSENMALVHLRDAYEQYDKNTYYPLVQQIFECLNINCLLGRHGVNALRADAILFSEDDTIPIEIKSPREEKNIGVKSIRQALENKIVLQSRRTRSVRRDTASLVIGWDVPNQRGEAFELIQDIKYTYDISIAVLGIDYLLKLCIQAVKNNKSADFADFASIPYGVYR